MYAYEDRVQAVRLFLKLEIRLFQRSTRKLTLTEAGEQSLVSIDGNLLALQAALPKLQRKAASPQVPSGSA